VSGLLEDLLTQLDGSYRIDRELGGGMSRILLAEGSRPAATLPAVARRKTARTALRCTFGWAWSRCSRSS